MVLAATSNFVGDFYTTSSIALFIAASFAYVAGCINIGRWVSGYSPIPQLAEVAGVAGGTIGILAIVVDLTLIS
jgi:hypothetical protein